MKKLLLLLPLWLLPCLAAAQPQSVVWEMPSLNYDTTIVRHWQGDEYIVYSSSGTGPGIVSYHDNASGTTISATLPSNVIIKDFRIAHDSVFAGGAFINSLNSYGLLACFDINIFLSGTLNYKYCRLYPNPLSLSECSTDYDDVILSVKRLALYEHGGATRIAYIADNNITETGNSLNVVYHRVGYGDAAYLTNGWDICMYHYNKDGKEDFTDICTTDNKIVLVALSTDSSHLRFQALSKTRDFANLGASSFPPGYCFYDHKVLDKGVMVTPIAGDMVSMACHYDDGADAAGLTVKTVDVGSSTPTLLSSLDIVADDPSNTPSWHINDMQYSKEHDQLLILNRISQSLAGCNSYVFHLYSPTIPYINYDAETCQLGKDFQSLDLFDTQKYIISGNSGIPNPIVFIKPIAMPSNCSVVTTKDATKFLPKMYLWGHHHCTYQPVNNNSGYYSITNHSNPINPTCIDF